MLAISIAISMVVISIIMSSCRESSDLRVQLQDCCSALLRIAGSLSTTQSESPSGSSQCPVVVSSSGTSPHPPAPSISSLLMPSGLPPSLPAATGI